MPSAQEVKEVFKSAPGAKAIRYPGPQTAGTGKQGYIWTCRLPYSLQALEHKARNQVRQGLKNCQVKAITLAELQELGARAHADTMKRLKIDAGVEIQSSRADQSGVRSMGAFVEGNLAAYLVTLRIADWAFIQINRFRQGISKTPPQQRSRLHRYLGTALAPWPFNGQLRLGSPLRT